jgi:hypothetical protein
MQLNSQLMQVEQGRIRIAKEANDAFILTSSFLYQIDNRLLKGKSTLPQFSNFEFPLAFKSRDGLYQVFAGWISLQPPFISSKNIDRKISAIVYDAKPKRLEAIAWEYVLFALSRTHHRSFVLSQVCQTIVTCPSFISYRALYERRLLPCLLHANEVAQTQGVKTIITIPGLGCGQFAGKFKGQLGSTLKQVLSDLLTRYAAQLSSVKAVYYDPFDECENERLEIEHISLLVRPLLKDNEGKGQLCLPSDYEDINGEFSDCTLTSFVAWDHVSWPGNDFYIGSRATDDGVKAAATSTMAMMTSFTGQYSVDSNSYQPLQGYQTWGDVVSNNDISLICSSNLKIY